MKMVILTFYENAVGLGLLVFESYQKFQKSIDENPIL